MNRRAQLPCRFSHSGRRPTRPTPAPPPPLSSPRNDVSVPDSPPPARSNSISSAIARWVSMGGSVRRFPSAGLLDGRRNCQNQDFQDYGIYRITLRRPRPTNPDNPANPVNPDSDEPCGRSLMYRSVISQPHSLDSGRSAAVPHLGYGGLYFRFGLFDQFPRPVYHPLIPFYLRRYLALNRQRRQGESERRILLRVYVC